MRWMTFFFSSLWLHVYINIFFEEYSKGRIKKVVELLKNDKDEFLLHIATDLVLFYFAALVLFYDN